jgi:Raf kinase inhibitor-like YbhB/YbcL family protein
MLARRMVGSVLLAGVFAFASAGDASMAQETAFTLTSPAFKDGGTVPLKHGGNLKENANCLGENISPALTWSNVPAGTKSFAILFFDPEGRGGLGVSQWVAYGIPATTTGFAEGEGSQVSDKFVAGKSLQGLPPHYLGPCAPRGAPHHYVFTLIATDFEPNALQPGLTREEFLAALPGHSKGATGLVGFYARAN